MTPTDEEAPPLSGNMEEKVNLILKKLNEFDIRIEQMEKTTTYTRSFFEEALLDVLIKLDRPFKLLGFTIRPAISTRK